MQNNKLTFDGNAYRIELSSGVVYEGSITNLIAHFSVDTITICDRATKLHIPIMSSRANILEIDGEVKTFEQAQVLIEDALSSAGGASSADKVSYDNTNSGLTATNVQGAIDEIGANLGEISPKVNTLMSRADVIVNSAENVAYKNTNVASELDKDNAIINGNSVTITATAEAITTTNKMFNFPNPLVVIDKKVHLKIKIQDTAGGTLIFYAYSNGRPITSNINLNVSANTYKEVILQLDLSDNADKIDAISIRCNSGSHNITAEFQLTTIEGLKSELSTASDRIKTQSMLARNIDLSYFECGNITINGSGWTYSDSTTRLRTKQNLGLKLKRGDVIHFDDYSDIRYYLGWRTLGGSYSYKGWITEDFKVLIDGEYCILISNKTERGILEVNSILTKMSILHNDTTAISFYKGVNHRGYNVVAPENTLSAYRLSKEMGFQIVETDIQFTSDGVAVLLHDDTIDRTSNGSGSISSMTFEQVRQYDFGSRKSAVYAGEKIPSLEEFIALCRNLNMSAYLELKNNATEQQINDVIRIIEGYGMRNNVTFISFYKEPLQYIHSVRPQMRLGLVVSTINQSSIDAVNTLRGEQNEVFIDSSSRTQSEIDLCKANGVPLEVWTLNDENTIKGLNPYISGVTSDSVNSANIFTF